MKRLKRFVKRFDFAQIFAPVRRYLRRCADICAGAYLTWYTFWRPLTGFIRRNNTTIHWVYSIKSNVTAVFAGRPILVYGRKAFKYLKAIILNLGKLKTQTSILPTEKSKAKNFAKSCKPIFKDPGWVFRQKRGERKISRQLLFEFFR